MNYSKDYAIYCSGGASRVLKFFKNKSNLKKYSPNLVVYDGDKIEVVDFLHDLFSTKLCWIDKTKLEQDEINRINTYTSEVIYNNLLKYKCEYLICFGEKILKKILINSYNKKIINFHPSILPAYKGLNAIDQALENNASVIGNTAHYINEKIDDGDIIIQSVMLSEDFNDYEDVLELQLTMFKIILRDVLKYSIDYIDLYIELKDRVKPYLMPEKI